MINNETISASEFIFRANNGLYKPTGYLGNGKPVTREAVQKGLAYIGKSDYLDLLAEQKEIKKQVEEEESQSEEIQVANLEKIRKLWAKEAKIEEEIEKLIK